MELMTKTQIRHIVPATNVQQKKINPPNDKLKKKIGTYYELPQ
jgi:hypothetical protein